MSKIEQTKGGWSVQLRIGAGRRRNFTIAVIDPAVAEARAALMTELARLLVDSGRLAEAHEALTLLGLATTAEEAEAVAEGARELCAEPLSGGKGQRRVTFRELADDWTSGRLAKRHPDQIKIKKSAKDDRQRLATLCLAVGDVPVAAFSLDDAERAMRALPASVQSASTRRQYAQLIRHLLKLAVYPCRIITASPIPRGFAPKPARQPDFVCLYPDEESRLMACVEIPLEVRAVYGFVCREGARLANVFDLTWDDLDLDRGLIRLPVTKSGVPLEWDLNPSVVRMLVALRARNPELPSSATVFPQLDRTTLSKRLRADLLTAGLTRSALHEATASSEALRFHDLRASFITFALLNGRSEAWVTQRTGHTTSQMMYRYKRPHLANLPQKDWSPLDVALGLAAPADGAAPGAEVEHGGDVPRAGDDQLASAAASPAAQLVSEGAHEAVPALRAGQAEQLVEVGVGELATGNVHGALQNSGVFGWQPLAATLAVNFFGVSFSLEDSSMIQPVYLGGSRGDRTPDLRIKSSASDVINQPKTAGGDESSSIDRTKAPEAQPELPMSSLSDDMLAELTELAVAGKRWHLVAALGADLDAISRSRATQSNVTQLLVERRKRGAR